MTPEMWAGWHPDTSRAWLAPRLPLPISQPTHDVAPFSPEMAAGWQPTHGIRFTAKPGWIWSETTFVQPMTPEEFAGWQPARGVHFVRQLGWIWSEHTFVEAMTPEMFAGWSPLSPRLLLGPRIPLPLHQATAHDEAPFIVSMTAARQPLSARLFQGPRIGWMVTEAPHGALITLLIGGPPILQSAGYLADTLVDETAAVNLTKHSADRLLT